MQRSCNPILDKYSVYNEQIGRSELSPYMEPAMVKKEIHSLIVKAIVASLDITVKDI